MMDRDMLLSFPPLYRKHATTCGATNDKDLTKALDFRASTQHDG